MPEPTKCPYCGTMLHGALKMTEVSTGEAHWEDRCRNVLRGQLADRTRERDQALCLLGAHIEVDSERRHVTILDLDEVDMSVLPFDAFEVYEAARAAVEKLNGD